MIVSFGERLLISRKRKKLSQEQLAHQAGIPAKELADYEGDAISPSFNVALRLADILDISMDFLACRMNEPIEAENLKRMAEIQNMASESKGLTLEIIDMLIRDDKRMKIH
ncbi:MAG: helix-turn-helix domain-containing protein [bacterium]